MLGSLGVVDKSLHTNHKLDVCLACDLCSDLAAVKEFPNFSQLSSDLNSLTFPGFPLILPNSLTFPGPGIIFWNSKLFPDSRTCGNPVLN